MASQWRWWIAVVSVACSVSAGDHLSDLLPLRDGNDAVDGSLDYHVNRWRNVFLQHVRCGAPQGIPVKLCRDCLSAERILNITRTRDNGDKTSVRDLGRLSVVFLNYLLSFRTSCTADSVRLGYVGSCRTYEECWSEVNGGYLAAMMSTSNSENLEALEKILRQVKAVFEPEPSKRCFSAEMVLNELNMKSKKLENLPRVAQTVLLLTSHLYSGECIDVGESVADFLDDIFLHYGNGCQRVMTQSGFTKLWNDLQMQRRGKHIDHGVQKNSCFPGTFEYRTSDAEKPTSASSSDKVTDTTAETPSESMDMTVSRATQNPLLYDESTAFVRIPVNKEIASNTTMENSTTVMVLIPPARRLDNQSEEEMLPQNSDIYILGNGNHDKERENTVTADDAPIRRARHTPVTGDHEHKNLANECLPSDDLLQRFLTPGNQVITSSEFLQLCPALVQQAVSGVCSARLKGTALDAPRLNRTMDVFQQVTPQSANPWFAVAAVSLITAASLFGLFLLPVLKKSFFVHINAFFTGLAFGTMSGDVVLHIMPQYLGLHQHEDHDHEDETTFERLFPSHLQRQLVFLLTMYLLLLVESIFTVLTGEKKEHHGHSHGPVDISLGELNAIGDVENGETKPSVSRCTKITEFLRPSNLFSGISSKAAVIVLADTVHNFADGMAIAVGFSTSYKDGFSTSVAVFFHELPHEIGDFAILMNCGLSYWKAFVFNILSGLSAFIGLGVGVFTATLFREWLLCITAGLFFFVVMGEMLPDMRLESKEKWREFSVKVIGTVFGIFTMICIAMYELSTA